MLQRNMVSIPILLLAAATLAGCGSHAGSFDVDDGAGTKWNNLVAMVTFKDQPPQPRPMDPEQCPEIFVLNGASADRVYKTGAEGNDALRYQVSIDDVARDCRADSGQISLKVGVQGTILIGPAGSAGSYMAPIRVLVVRTIDQGVVLSKLYKVPANIASGQTQAPFTLVTEPLNVPYSTTVHDFSIQVGFDSAIDNKKRDKNAPATQAQQASVPASSSDRPHRYHRRFHTDQAQQ